MPAAAAQDYSLAGLKYSPTAYKSEADIVAKCFLRNAGER
jgi:hypothetical protein